MGKPSLSYAALLRGVNVGGKNKLPMKDLAALFEKAGCVSVTTYIQSGNVVFSADAECAKMLAPAIARKIEERFGYRIPVLLRSAEQLASVIRDNPYLREGVPEKELYVAFLASPPPAEKIKDLDPARSLPDSFRASGQEIYLHLPNGIADSKLTNAWFDTKLSTVSTVRNWATVLRLYAMTEQLTERR